MKYYKLRGSGRLTEISKIEYEGVMRKVTRPSYWEELMQDMHGFQFQGVGYLWLQERNK